MAKTKILVTGGAGFIGSEFMRQVVKEKHTVVMVDKLTYAGDMMRLDNIEGNYRFYKADISSLAAMDVIFNKEKPSHIIHFAAETHVDRSLLDSRPFIKANIHGTQNLIDLALKYKAEKFIHISTDEVYGACLSGSFDEQAPLNPTNPYSVTKAAAEQLVQSYIKTHQLPAIILRPSNNYGHWQYPEKFIPVACLKAMHDQPIPVYGQGKQIREWLHVTDCAKAILLIMQKGALGEIYNISSNLEQENIKTARQILSSLDKSESLIEFIRDRPGHDFRYSINCNKLRKLGWSSSVNIADGIRTTAVWYQENKAWLKKKRRALERYWSKVYISK